MQEYNKGWLKKLIFALWPLQKIRGKKKLAAKKSAARSLNVTEPCKMVIKRTEPIGNALV